MTSEESFEWLEAAEEDLEAARELSSDLDKISIYHLHQSAEKALKAIQLYRKNEYDYSHDLMELTDDEIGERFADLLTELNPAYTGNRYPDQETGSVENLEELIIRTEELLEWIKKQLKK